jgi:hypothetical protein
MANLMLWLIVLVVAFPIAIFLGFIPGKIAHDRGHVKASDVKTLGLIGIIIPLVWIAALIWAYVGETNREEGRREPVDRSIYDPLEDVHAPFDDSMVDLDTPNETDKCANCGRAIGKLETPHVWKDAVVCGACRKILEQAEPA